MVRLLLGGATHEEVAGNFGVSRSTVTTRWNEVRDAMRAQYEGGALKREVAAKHGLTEAEVDLVLRQFGDPLNFEPEYGSLWAGFRIDERFGQRHPGNLPAALVRNLLCFYSRPGDVILDPFCGGGVVLDVARDMVDRTAYGFDLDPRRPDIAKWDITGGPPPVPRAPDLVFLDPPYAGMKAGQYSGHPSELSELTVEGFLEAMERIFGYWDRGRLVLVMGCLRREGEFVALPYECARRMETQGWRLVDWVANQVHRPASESGLTAATQRRQRVVMRSHVDVVVGEKGRPITALRGAAEPTSSSIWPLPRPRPAIRAGTVQERRVAFLRTPGYASDPGRRLPVALQYRYRSMYKKLRRTSQDTLTRIQVPAGGSCKAGSLA